MLQKLSLGIICLLAQTTHVNATEVAEPTAKQPPAITESDSRILPNISEEVELAPPSAITDDIQRSNAEVERLNREALHQQESINIQSWMKWIAIVMAVIAFIQTCIVGLGTLLLRRTLKVTSKATDAAIEAAISAREVTHATKEIGTRQLRPYLVISQISNINAGPIDMAKRNQPRAGHKLSATINNAGLTPAYNIKVALKIVSDKGLIWETALIYGAIIKEIPSTFDKIFKSEVFSHFQKYPDAKGSLWIVIEYEDATSQEFTQRYNYDLHLPAPNSTTLKVELSLKPSMEETLSITP